MTWSRRFSWPFTGGCRRSTIPAARGPSAPGSASSPRPAVAITGGRPAGHIATARRKRHCGKSRTQQPLWSLWNASACPPLLEMMGDQFEPATMQAFRRVALEGATGVEAAGELGLSVAAVYTARSRVLRATRGRRGADRRAGLGPTETHACRGADPARCERVRRSDVCRVIMSGSILRQGAGWARSKTLGLARDSLPDARLLSASPPVHSTATSWIGWPSIWSGAGPARLEIDGIVSGSCWAA